MTKQTIEERIEALAEENKKLQLERSSRDILKELNLKKQVERFAVKDITDMLIKEYDKDMILSNIRRDYSDFLVDVVEETTEENTQDLLSKPLSEITTEEALEAARLGRFGKTKY